MTVDLLPSEAADWSPASTVVFKLGHGENHLLVHIQGRLHVLKVHLLQVQGVVLLQHILHHLAQLSGGVPVINGRWHLEHVGLLEHVFFEGFSDELVFVLDHFCLDIFGPASLHMVHTVTENDAAVLSPDLTCGWSTPWPQCCSQNGRIPHGSLRPADTSTILGIFLNYKLTEITGPSP